jgi:hypothetical protein
MDVCIVYYNNKIGVLQVKFDVSLLMQVPAEITSIQIVVKYCPVVYQE